ncbi:MAG: hypothetical protein M3R46_11095 [Actinomycetota bacterium]|nr:hypothetical protein [Actinomycetota bacterium]
MTADLVGLRLEVAGHRDFWLPRGERPGWVDNALTQTEAWLPGSGEPALRATLLSPARVYELEAISARRRVAVLGAVTPPDGEPCLIRALLEASTAGKHLADCGDLEFACASLASLDARELLGEVASGLTAPSLRAPDPDGAPPTALVVGDASLTERKAIERRLWTHGVRVEAFLDQPYRRIPAAVERVQAFKGSFLVLNIPGCGDVAGQLLGAANAATGPLFILQEEELEYLLLELDDRLDEASVDLTEPPTDAVKPQGWRTAAEQARSLQGQDGSFVLTKKCSAGLEKTPYPNAARMVDQLEKLARLAAKWTEREGSLNGSFEEWARAEEGLEIALRDKKLTALKLHRFEHDGRSYSREPHVQVDDAKAFTECGRIYFAIDKRPYRFIVDHIGLHPY